jgi:predicted esterase
LLSACNRSPATPLIIQQTPTIAVTETSTPTPVPDIYEQNIHLFAYDSESSVKIPETSVEQEDGYTLHVISYPSPKEGEVPAYLVVPATEGPFAGIILMHGSSGSREDLLPFARDLAETGAVVLTISAPSARPEPNSREWITFTLQDREDQIQLMLDLRRGVDLLTQHEKVDPARIGYGFMVGDGGLVNHFTDGDTPIGGFETIGPAARERWLKAMEPIEPIYFVSHASPSALFFQNAQHDMSVSEEDALAYQTAGSEPKQVKWYNSGHGLPPQAFVDMVNWLGEQIGINATKFN